MCANFGDPRPRDRELRHQKTDPVQNTEKPNFERTKSRTDKIPNLTKSGMEKIPIWTKFLMEKIPN